MVTIRPGRGWNRYIKNKNILITPHLEESKYYMLKEIVVTKAGAEIYKFEEVEIIE